MISNKYVIIPHLILIIISSLFFPFAIILLIRLVSHSSNNATKSLFKSLGWRLLVYFICIEFLWINIIIGTYAVK